MPPLTTGSAQRTWVASAPLMLAVLVTVSESMWPDNAPRRPTKNTTVGTKKRKSRKAMALPRTEPAATRSRS